ncbi:aminopeptidase [Salipiger bermudensis]|uniref:Probable aminopeptidase protein n=1 Tax=Salipiger bermudensis (strain DSM 26914 / JCM 13377 / KCTC 12554 / HTCC2601) TaxID=314265 RepID=Q0FGX7_SALBH|nr:aminopeptidase [Salipiger bermudensis]EAU43450.1 probable aminopeptidase protein [Salipiger bermudensis HTCC2601]
MTDSPIDPTQVQRLADVAVRTGLNLQPGQELVLTAPIDAAPLVRAVAAAAYEAGASLVTPIFADPGVSLARYGKAGDESFDTAAGWLYEGMAEAFKRGAARMAIVGEDPMLLAEQDAAKVSRAGKANSAAYKPALEKIANFEINWSICAWPGQAWAQRMFPDLAPSEAQAKLAEAIFAASRVDRDDPVAAWAEHNATLRTRTEWLNEQRFSALHFKSPGTDLIVGLADDHEWHGGASEAQNGVVCNPNIPTEEVFTTPHAHRVDGTVRSTKPLSHQGSLIDGIEVTFKDGRIIEAKAEKGGDILRELIATDEGAARLGEVALVPHSSPISQSGLLFYNTLFDENAACHIALGQCYSKCFLDGASLSAEEVAEKGGNASLIHVDWMIGGADTDIDGITPDGTRVPVFRGGEWA